MLQPWHNVGIATTNSSNKLKKKYVKEEVNAAVAKPAKIMTRDMAKTTKGSKEIGQSCEAVLVYLRVLFS